jgi:hypothetical protein
MTIEKFYQTLTYLNRLDETLNLQQLLGNIRDNLNNLVASPAAPTHQSSLASSLTNFTSAVESLRATLTPADMAVIAEVGGEEFFDPLLATKVKESIEKNAMTPTVARDFVQDIASRRAKYLETIRSTIDGLTALGVKDVSLVAGTADMAFVIPRDLFKNHLGPFARELSFINRMIDHFSEAVLENPEPVKLEGLSSSTPTIGLEVGVKVIEAIASTVVMFLVAWEKVKKLRHVRSEVAELGLKNNLHEFTEQIKTTVDDVVEESVKITLTNFKGDANRRNELETALRQDTLKLFGQIEKGLTIQFRAEPDDDAVETDKNALAAVAKMSRTMQFPEPEKGPLLLADGEDMDEDDPETITASTRRIRRTTTTTTTNRGRIKKEDAEGPAS